MRSSKRRGRWGGGIVGLGIFVVAATLASGPAFADHPISDLRVRSEQDETILEVTASGRIDVVDRNVHPGSTPAAALPMEGARGEGEVGEPEAPKLPELLASGETFLDELRLGLPGTLVRRPASITVGDGRVSEVRIRPEATGSALAIFVRRSVRYEVWRDPSETRLEIRIAAAARTAASHAPGRTSPSDEERAVSVDAESVRYDRRKNMVVAEGGVAVRRAGLDMTADEVQIDRNTYDGDAFGNVVVRTSAGTIRGDRLHLNLIDETGWIENGDVDLSQGGYQLLGDRIDKGYGQTYRTERGIVTTCRCGGLEKPVWSIAARRMDVDLFGTGVARHLTFRVKDVPVFYFPIGAIPVNKTRQSGFLFPHVGYSPNGKTTRGFLYEQPFFWAINKSSDATFAFDIETKSRVGGVGEYRYALAQNSFGTLSVAYWNEILRSFGPLQTIDVDNNGLPDRDENGDVIRLPEVIADYRKNLIVEEPPDDRWGFFTEMRQRVPGGVNAYLDTIFVSDDLFFNEVDSATFQPAREAAARTESYTATRVGFVKHWEQASLWGETTYYQDLDLLRKDEDKEVLQRVPRVEFSSRRSVLRDHVGLSLTAEGIDYQRQEGFDGLRLDVRPKATVPFQLGNVLFGSVEGGVRGTAYYQTDRSVNRCQAGPKEGSICVSPDNCRAKVCTNGDQKRICRSDSDCGAGEGLCTELVFGCEPDMDLKRTETRGAFHAGAQVGTELSRVFRFERWGFTQLKHTIEPTVSYLFIPSIDDQGQLPFYDGVDRINRRSLISYGFVSRLKGRLDAPPPETTGAPAGPDASEAAAETFAWPTEPEDWRPPLAPEEEEWAHLIGPGPGELVSIESAEEAALRDSSGALSPSPTPPLPGATEPPLPGAPSVREIVRLSALQVYDTERLIAGDSHASDVDLGLRLTPNNLLAFIYGATYNVRDNKLQGTSVTLTLREPWAAPNPQLASLQAPSGLSISYRFIREDLNANPQRLGQEDLNGSLYLRIGRMFGLLLHGRFNLVPDEDLNQKTVREAGVGARYVSRCDCWMAEVGVDTRTEPVEETVLRGQVTLTGLGSLGRGSNRAVVTTASAPPDFNVQ